MRAAAELPKKYGQVEMKLTGKNSEPECYYDRFGCQVRRDQ
jgi:hypothetical protein